MSRDLRAPDGGLALGSLAALEHVPLVEWRFLGHGGDEVDPRDVEDVDALLLFAPSVSARTLSSARRLRLVARLGAGYDRAEVERCARRGVAVTTTPDGVRRPMASAGLALLLALAHRLVIKDRLVRAGAWDRRLEHIGDGLVGRTLGLLGFGNIGRELARLARPFEMRQIAYTPRLTPADARREGVEAVTLETLLGESDYLVVACPLTSETRGLLDAGRLAAMKPSASLINIARGAVVDEAALTAALRAGRLAGAALDVFEHEPLDPSSPLLELDSVIVAPHAAGQTDDLFAGCFASACRSILEVVAGRVPDHVVRALPRVPHARDARG